MSDKKACCYCDRSDVLRESDGKIRCRAYSMWTDPWDCCRDYRDRINKEERQLFKDAIAGMEELHFRNQNPMCELYGKEETPC